MGVMGKMDEMKKYIIEFSEDPHTIRLIKVKNGDKFPITEFKTVKPYTEPDLDEIRARAYEEGLNDAKNKDTKDFADMYDSGYNEGLKDAWEAARKIPLNVNEGGLSANALTTIFGNKSIIQIFKEFSASEVVEKIRQYEQEQEEFKLWDEVDGKGGRGIITKISDDSDHFNVMWENGSTGYYMIGDFKKTGRNFPEIAEVLRKMQEVRE